MFTLITVFFSLIFIGLTIGLTGWTITTYIVKADSKKFIKEELTNLFDICKMLLVSLKSLIVILAKYSFPSHSEETIPAESNGLDEQPLKVVQPVEVVEAVETRGMVPSLETVDEETDTAMSSFSPELIEVITEEEEKVA